MNFRKHLIAVAVTAAIVVPATAHATNGYFALAYGAKARGVGGATTALPQDSMAAASNPAGMGHVGNRADLNVEVFSPIRESDTPFGHFESGQNGFIIPTGGYVRQVNDQTSLGVTIYANGGMNTFYDNGGGMNPNPYGYPDNLGVDLAQLVFAPTIAYKLNNTHTIGASVLIGYQQFKAYGLQGFCGLKGDGLCDGTSTDPDIGTAAANKGLTNQGYDDAWGLGVRIGWQGNISEQLTLGAAYSSKIYMNEFGKYDKLFAEEGDFDIPANWSIGMAYKASPKLTVSADIQQILYEDVKSIANAGPNTTNPMNPFADGQGFLGTDNGLGFGWDNMTIVKLGAVYEYNDHFTYRFGVSHGSQPIPDDELAFNVLAPAVIETHATAGFSYRPSGKDDQEISVTYMHAFENDVRGAFPAAFNGGTVGVTSLQMYQHALEIGYAWKF